MNSNMLLHEVVKPVLALAPILPSSSTPDYVSLKNFARFTAIIAQDNATTVTGSAITLKQATAVAGTGEKALAFTKMYTVANIATTDLLVETAVTSDTFTTDATNAINSLYVIEVEASELDVANDFDCIRVGTGDAVALVLSVTYLLWPSRYATKAINQPSAIID